MEHFFRTFIGISLFLVVGCNKANPNPELIDPIYKDLSSQVGLLKKEIETNQAKIKKYYKLKKKGKQGDVNLKDVRGSKKLISSLNQKIKFFKIRLERRKLEAKRLYKIEFDKNGGKEWPNAEEFKHYKANRSLRNASRNWAARVPRLSHRYSPKTQENQTESASKEESEAPSGH